MNTPTGTGMLAPEARAGLDEPVRSTPLGRLGQPADIAGSSRSWPAPTAAG